MYLFMWIVNYLFYSLILKFGNHWAIEVQFYKVGSVIWDLWNNGRIKYFLLFNFSLWSEENTLKAEQVEGELESQLGFGTTISFASDL